MDKDSDLYQSLEQLDWEVAYGIPKTKLAWRKSGMLEWVVWPEAKLWIRVTTALERDAVLFDYLEGAEVYFVDHEKYVVREEKIRRCDIWKDQWAKICLETLPLQKESSLGEWTNGEILIVKDEVELAVLPLRWIYLPAIPDVLRFRDVRLYRNVSSVLEASDSTTALSCFARKGLRNVLAVYRAENAWGKDWFRFYITKYGVLPKGTPDSTSFTFSKYCINASQATYGGKFGEACTAWVLYNENMDYLHCDDLSWEGKTKCK